MRREGLLFEDLRHQGGQKDDDEEMRYDETTETTHTERRRDRRTVRETGETGDSFLREIDGRECRMQECLGKETEGRRVLGFSSILPLLVLEKSFRVLLGSSLFLTD